MFTMIKDNSAFEHSDKICRSHFVQIWHLVIQHPKSFAVQSDVAICQLVFLFGLNR